MSNDYSELIAKLRKEDADPIDLDIGALEAADALEALVRELADAVETILAADAKIDEQASEIEALRVDAERLDWIERQHLEELSMQLVVDAQHDGEYYVCGDSNRPGYGPTLRAAIDAAMQAGKGVTE